jgi:hypothetical protein
MSQTVSNRSVLGILAIVIVSFGGPARAAHLAETLTDRCSVEVVIKVPFTDDEKKYREISPKDVILDRTGKLKNLIQPQGPNRGVTGLTVVEKGKHYTEWTPRIPIPKNGDGFFRWICGTTAERSRCASEAKWITARLGEDRLLETKCWK